MRITSTSFVRRLAAASALALALGAAYPLAQLRTLPPFVAATLDDAPVESATLALDGNWLLVVVQPRCRPCDALLAHVDRDERPAASRILVVGAGMDGAAVAELKGRYPNIAQARWLADPTRDAAKALDVQTSPTVYGLRGNAVEWRLAGAIRDARELESILFTWLEKQ